MQSKSRKNKYLNTRQRRKAAFRGRGFQFNSQINKSMNFVKNSLKQNGQKITNLLRRTKTGGEGNE